VVTPSALDSYRVVYRIEDRAPGAKPSVTTETIEVRRPYDGRVIDEQGGRVLTGRITSRRHFWQLGDGGALRFGVLREPSGPARDASLAALRDAARAHVVVERGTDRVLGRDCAWFAYRDPAPSSLAPPDKASRIESCVDSGGIVLREEWTLHGRRARIVRAVSIGSPPAASAFLEGQDPATTKVTEPKGADLIETLTQTREVSLSAVRQVFRVSPPPGWRADRVAVVATAPQGSRPTQFLSQAFVRGAALTVVDTASSPNLPPPWPVSQGRPLRIGVGEGRIVYYADRVEIRLLSAVGYARVTAPSVEVAMQFIRGLTAA
jgi:hypothetical protein